MHCFTRKCNGFSEIQTMFIWDWLDRLSVYVGAFLNWSEWIQTDPKLDLQKTGSVAIWIHSKPVPEWSRVNTWTGSKALHVNRSQSGDCGGVKGKMEHKEKVLHLSFALQFPSAWNRLEMVVKLNELSVFIKLLTDVFNSQWATAHGVCCFFILLVSSSKSKLKIEITILFNGGFHVQLNLSEWPQSHLIR